MGQENTYRGFSIPPVEPRGSIQDIRAALEIIAQMDESTKTINRLKVEFLAEMRCIDRGETADFSALLFSIIQCIEKLSADQEMLRRNSLLLSDFCFQRLGGPTAKELNVH